MCGIALIVCGIRIDLSSIQIPNSATGTEQILVSLDDIKSVLKRRGPDSIGSKDIFLYGESASSLEGITILSSTREDEPTQRMSQYCSQMCDYVTLRNEESPIIGNGFPGTGLSGRLHFIGATLQLRGINPVTQPLVDKYGNILVYNGEIFGGIEVDRESNDTEVLMESLRNCCTCRCQQPSAFCCGNGKTSVPELLSTIRGPWALIYWQESSKTIWFGRDAFGRRSLLVHWPSSKDSRLLLSSVAPSSSIGENFEDENELNFWEELSCGVYSIFAFPSKLDGSLVGELNRHQWSDPVLKELIEWDRINVKPKPEELMVSRNRILVGQQSTQSASSIEMLSDIGHIQTAVLRPSQSLLIVLREAVRRRTTFTTVHQTGNYNYTKTPGSPVAVLFSGGLDSMILAALLDECLDPKYEIDLLNVSFDGESAPDRISARAGVSELREISTLRRWKLVEIDADLSKLTSETKHVMSLINPAKTYMDLNIGTALWLAASGDGWINKEISENSGADYKRVKYKSESKILLVGAGADEQCAGYGRHRTKYREGSWTRLYEEMKIDMQRIWKRNLGRDDRCIADSGKEARFPFLDEDVIRTLLDFPLWEIADLDQPAGLGDKKILREVAQLLGLHEAAVLPKRAIQFGSRIARESNRKNFGSNRAANQASAGSFKISMTSNSS